MKIGIIGAGAIGKTYGELFKRAGHEVMLSSRNPENIEAGNYQIGTVTQAAAFGEVIILAVNYRTVNSAIDQMKNHFDGKLVIDTTNPLYSDENGNLKQLIGENEVAGVVMQQKINTARVAKAFTTLWTGYVEQYSNVLEPSLVMTGSCG
jgi:predicted dinucleotide-binding enzyme